MIVPAGFEQPLQGDQGLHRPREVLQDEADEHVIERFRLEWQRKHVGPVKLHVGEAGRVDPSLRFGQRVGGNVDRREARTRAAGRQGDGLRADAASGFEHPAAVGVCRVRMQEVNQRIRLIFQARIRAAGRSRGRKSRSMPIPPR